MSDNKIMNALPIIIVLALGLIAVGLVAHNTARENKRLRRNADYIAKTYLRKQGVTTLYPGAKGQNFNYELRSFDAGKTWYAVKYDFEKETVTVLGDAETVYPGLLKHLDAMDALTTYVSKQGTLNLNESLERNLLENAGFQVVTRP